MLEGLILNNFNSGFEPELEADHKSFVMATCQRTLVISYQHSPILNITSALKHDYLDGSEAYSYLLEIICGLKSKMVGENEIVGQFKEAYQNYIKLEEKCSHVLQIVEKLFKDAKTIRSQYLMGLSQKTYSSIARKHIVSKHKAKEVLILGSGLLAEDLINQFKKKITVYISGRNSEKVNELAQLHGLEIVPWGNTDHYQEFAFIANSIGFKGVFLNDNFFQEWVKKHSNRLFVDLGSPSAIQTNLDYAHGVMKLEDVFGEGAVHEDHKIKQIKKARTAMEGIVNKRQEVFRKKKEKKIFTPNKANMAYVSTL